MGMQRVVAGIADRLREHERIRTPVRRLRRLWRARSSSAGRAWSERAEQQWSAELRTYLDLPIDAVRHLYGGKTSILYATCLALRPGVIVELGSAFSWYDFGRDYEAALRASDEGLSTRVLLAAARLIAATGSPAHVYSVDLRNPEQLRLRLPQDFGLQEHLTYALGVDSVSWLRGFDTKIGVLFTDSHHTRRQILAALDAALPLMEDRAAILVDNCYTTAYTDEPREDIEQGGKYGALVEWTRQHPDWIPTWTRHDLLLLTRGWSP